MTAPPSSPRRPPAPVVELEVGGGANQDLEVVQQQQQLPGQTPNPMLIDVVLDNLFGYCDFESLSACRRVSQQWHKASLPHWLRKGPPLTTLHLSPRLEPYRSPDDRKDKLTTMSKFLRLVDNDFAPNYGPYEFTGLRQYQNFDIRGDLGTGIERQFLGLFFRTCGATVRELSLLLDFPTWNTYRTVMLSTRTPNLAKLQVDVRMRPEVINKLVEDDDREYDEVVEGEHHSNLTSLHISCNWAMGNIWALPLVGWIRLLKRYPNLQTITYEVARYGEPDGVNRLLEAIGRIRQLDKTVLSLKRLEIGCRSMGRLPFLLPLLRDSQLALETFSLSIGTNIPNQTIYDVLATRAVASSLKHLVLRNDTPLKDFQPPRMDSVKSLELVGYPFENLAFLRSFPNLQSLTFTSRGGPSSTKLRDILAATTRAHLKGAIIPSLTRLHCNDIEHQRDNMIWSDYIPKLQTRMANLTDLKLWLHNSSFRTVCQCWPRLQHLTILVGGNMFDDRGITGINPGRKRSPGKLTSLRALRSLTLMNFDKDYLNNAGPVPITPRSFPEFLRLPKLEKLEISVPYSEVDLDATLLRQIKEKIPFFKYNWARRRDEEGRPN